ncbi:phosphoacetylglucosamine mutase [Thecamonas trahens ATCC 50062]|uniref:Phosphoacetylglucosamine mutase n=1 Tax=Thecamonas trahens ATCC 50062 TaxID=461836 RepID=A0A0L0DSC8_THETB|nr:phosphoacetylglucosamine mutase [Thecamonas trahens ATCC 50062]KNC54363.1 phosphoacetylglucosamine mutase [Thecamonas trahens ATCC 50062]|eukprot:XP_013753817.1 phosphoacetylglucosamine mutase [Thecamonas trahens ATCC 50062]
MSLLPADITANLTAGIASYPKPDSVVYSYGTAGFRMAADLLDSVMFKVGILAAIRSKALGGACVGVMVTASHNPVPDNGVKLVEPSGDMLVPEYEKIAVAMANASTVDELAELAAAALAAASVAPDAPAAVRYGHDTRPSANRLVAALEAGLAVLPAVDAIPVGLVSTPQLHYLVKASNEPQFGIATLDGYNNKLIAAYTQLLEAGGAGNGEFDAGKLFVDGANGVGAPALAALLAAAGPDFALHASIVNDGSDPEVNILNHEAGADYVKSNQMPPPVLAETADRCAAFDGDADRVVYFFNSPSAGFVLLDGDKLASLMADYISSTLQVLVDAGLVAADELSLAVIQTAYANGASTTYLRNELGATVEFTKTGVKHLHHAALAYDIGVYFEANGHGTVVFSPKYVETLARVAANPDLATAPPAAAAATQLGLLPAVVNQAVGDAISDMLFIEAILRIRRLSVADWAALYTEHPNRLTKVAVADRTVFTTTNADQQLVEPTGMQDAIDALVAPVDAGRAFVRPSGTEDVVRVYAEASSQDAADALALAVAKLVYDTADGVGELVTSF